MVMHARKPQRLISDGYHQSHQYQSSKYGSSKREYDRETSSRSTTNYVRERDNSPTGASMNDSPRDRERDRDRDRERERDRDRYQSSGYTMSKLRDKERDRDYKKEKYSDSLRSPKRSRGERDVDHRTIHDRRFKIANAILDKRGISSDDRERERERERNERERDRDRDRDRIRERERDRSGGGGGNTSAGTTGGSSMGIIGSSSATSIVNALNSANAGSGILNACLNTTGGNTSCGSNVGGTNNAAVNSISQSNDRDRVSRVGDWSEHVSSSGKRYYYNCKTEVSQWEKPREWIEKESNRMLVKEQQRDYRDKDRDREKERGERERDERYTSSVVNRSSASSYGKHSSSSSSNSSKHNSRARWPTHESALTSHRRRNFDDENQDMDISPGDSTPTSEASYSHSSTPTTGQTHIGSQHAQTNNGIMGTNSSNHSTSISVSSSGTALAPSAIVSNSNSSNILNSDGISHSLSVHMPRMLSSSTANQIGLPNNQQTSLNHQHQTQHNVTSSSNSTSSSSSGASMSSPSLHHASHASGSASTIPSSSQTGAVESGMLSSNTPGPPSSAMSSQQHISTLLHPQQLGSATVQQAPQAQQQSHQQLSQSAIQPSSAGSGTSISVTTSLAGLPKILSQITGIKSMEHNDINPQKALQTINNALMMQQQSRQQISNTAHEMGGNGSTVINIREHALQSPLYNVSNLSHSILSSSLSIGSGAHMNHSTHHNLTVNNLVGSQSNMMHGSGLTGCSSVSAILTTIEGPPTPTQELDIPLVDHRKLVDGLGSTVVTTATSSAVSSLQSVMASSQCGRSQGPNLTPSLAKYFRADLISHVTGWPSEILEKTIQKLSEEAHILGDLQCSKVSAELKCARSLVRITEITATLQEQKIMYLRQQIRRLEESKSENSFMSSDDL